MKQDFVIDGYSFSSRAEYERAQKEKETILYLSAHTNLSDMKAVYRIYKQAVEKQSFRTVFGLKYMENLRQRLLGSEFITEDLLEPVPVIRVPGRDDKKAGLSEEGSRQIQKYKEEAEKAKAGRILKNLLIVMLLLIIGVMLFVTYQSQYSVFTYFTDYKENMRNELINEYEGWTNELEAKEAELEERERALEEKEKSLKE